MAAKLEMKVAAAREPGMSDKADDLAPLDSFARRDVVFDVMCVHGDAAIGVHNGNQVSISAELVVAVDHEAGADGVNRGAFRRAQVNTPVAATPFARAAPDFALVDRKAK